MSINLTPQLYADLRNSGFSNREIASKLNIPESAVSRKINQWFQQGFLLTYYNVYLDKLLYPIELSVIELNQRVSIDTYLYQIHPLTIYYSPLPKPTYFIYRRKYSEIDENYVNRVVQEGVCKKLCRVTIKGVIEKTIEPREEYCYSRITLENTLDNREELNVDEHDQFLAEMFFKYFNPPVSPIESNSFLIRSIQDLVRTNTYRNHYYRHLYNKLVKKRIVIRDFAKLDYSIIVLYTESLSSFYQVIYSLWSREIIEGIDQVNFISTDPVIAIIHCWISRDKYWSHETTHEVFFNTRYDIHIVKQVM